VFPQIVLRTASGPSIAHQEWDGLGGWFPVWDYFMSPGEILETYSSAEEEATTLPVKAVNQAVCPWHGDADISRRRLKSTPVGARQVQAEQRAQPA